ncbi:MAG: HAMP domain-containing histidine kinase [Bernardetiaceae bacterium]|nr:HAMP domain-containing histidine kinase [Bernardetiaceae bacterium]
MKIHPWARVMALSIWLAWGLAWPVRGQRPVDSLATAQQNAWRTELQLAEHSLARAQAANDHYTAYKTLRHLLDVCLALDDLEQHQHFAQQAHQVRSQLTSAQWERFQRESRQLDRRAKADLLDCQTQPLQALQAALQAQKPQQIALAQVALARCHQAVGDWAEAEAHLAQGQQALAALPRDTVARIALLVGQAQVKLGQKQRYQALKLAEQAAPYLLGELAPGPGLTQAKLDLGRLYHQLGHSPKALNLLRGGLAGAPTAELPQWSQLLTELCQTDRRYCALLGTVNQRLLPQQAQTIESLEEKIAHQAAEDKRAFAQLRESYARVRNEQAFYLTLVVAILASVFGYLMWKSRRRNKNLNRQLNLQQGEILAKNHTLSEQNQQLQLLNNDKNDLMSMLAHDMRSPLNAVAGLSKLVAMEGNLNPDQHTYLQKIGETVQHANQMIRELLDVNALEQQTGWQLVPTHLPDLVNDVLLAQRQAAQAKNIRLFVSNDLASPIVHTAPDAVQRVVDNLVSNAIKFSPLGSAVYLSLGQTTGQVSIAVRDEGPGLSDDDRAKLFRKFQKLSARPTANEQSTGLGLAIVKTIVDKLGGHLTVESQLGKGATFILSLPRQPADSAPHDR